MIGDHQYPAHRLKNNELKVHGIGTKVTKIKSTAVQLVMDLIVKVKETCSFDMRWIRGHSGNKGQELADVLAKEAARENQQISITEVRLKYVKLYVQCKTAKEWQARWQNHMGAAKNFIQVVNPNKIKCMKKMSKKEFGGHLPSHN